VRSFVVFRTDASLIIGSGHVFRCLSLASALREKGASASFICRDHDKNLCALIAAKGFSVTCLAEAPATAWQVPVDDSLPVYASWLGTSWETDAIQTRSAIEALGEMPDWLIVDHYALDGRWEAALRPTARRIMVIDDLADRRHDCDLLLDQNLLADMMTRYAGKVPEHCGLMLGPEYALLQSDYAHLHSRILPREGPIKRVLVFFGSADTANVTGRSVAAFLRLDQPEVELDVIVPEDSPNADTVHKQVEKAANIHLHSRLPSLAQLMARADLAVGACGVTTWERCCLGLPSLVITLAENQRPIAAELHRRGLIRWLGHEDEVDDFIIERDLGNLLKNGLTPDWSQSCHEAVDGRGTARVCAVLTPSPDLLLQARLAGAGDEQLLLEWANDPTVRRNSFSPYPVSPETHQIWFRTRLRDLDGCHLYIVETDDHVPVGQVRFERATVGWEVHYSVAQAFRGKGVGRSVLESAIRSLCPDGRGVPISGRVKVGNVASRRVFEALGFECRSIEGGVVTYQGSFK
jgi:UDP-2,4-diacetamido-2,4,6-trideoxy-beta-L-altropyranose hydrolase